MRRPARAPSVHRDCRGTRTGRHRRLRQAALPPSRRRQVRCSRRSAGPEILAACGTKLRNAPRASIWSASHRRGSRQRSAPGLARADGNTQRLGLPSESESSWEQCHAARRRAATDRHFVPRCAPCLSLHARCKAPARQIRELWPKKNQCAALPRRRTAAWPTSTNPDNRSPRSMNSAANGESLLAAKIPRAFAPAKLPRPGRYYEPETPIEDQQARQCAPREKIRARPRSREKCERCRQATQAELQESAAQACGASRTESRNSRVEWSLGSPTIATRIPSRADVARSGTVSVL